MMLEFKLRSYGYYGESYLVSARKFAEQRQYERAVLDYQYSIECSLKEVLSCAHCTDKALMQSHDVLMLASAVFSDIESEERFVLRVLGAAYTQLRYPVEGEIEDCLMTLSSPDNPVLRVSDSLAVKSLEAAREARALLSSELGKIKRLKLD